MAMGAVLWPVLDHFDNFGYMFAQFNTHFFKYGESGDCDLLMFQATWATLVNLGHFWHFGWQFKAHVFLVWWLKLLWRICIIFTGPSEHTVIEHSYIFVYMYFVVNAFILNIVYVHLLQNIQEWQSCLRFWWAYHFICVIYWKFQLTRKKRMLSFGCNFRHQDCYQEWRNVCSFSKRISEMFRQILTIWHDCVGTKYMD